MCTLGEGRYHRGLAALINSLQRNGYRGEIFVGWRGSLPPWATGVDANGKLKVADGTTVVFREPQSSWYLPRCKPHFLLDLLKSEGMEALAYFDTDIVVRCDWSFFSDWIANGIALCEELPIHQMPESHPHRRKWQNFAEGLGYSVLRRHRHYFNSGFVGLTADQQEFLVIWQRLQDSLAERSNFREQHRLNPLDPFNTSDQDAFNLTTMLTSFPLSILGPEGMDLTPGGFTMSHAVGSEKPWSKCFLLSTLRGRGPSVPDREFLRYADHPIRAIPQASLFVKRWIDLPLALAAKRIFTVNG